MAHTPPPLGGGFPHPGVSGSDRSSILDEARVSFQTALEKQQLEVTRQIGLAVAESEGRARTERDERVGAAVRDSERKAADEYVSLSGLRNRLDKADYVEADMLDYHCREYAKKADLPDLAGATSGFKARVHDLEKEVLLPDGRLAAVEGRLEGVEERRVRDLVSMAGHDFKDQATTEAWVKSLGDDEAFRHAADWKVQLFEVVPPFSTLKDGLDALAASKKANFEHNQSSLVYLSFLILHLECVLRPSKAEKDADKEGWIFTPAFSSHKVFKGTLVHGTYASYKKSLETNRVKRQNQINAAFPPNQSKMIMPNAVFSEILRKGHDHAVCWLDAFDPFYTTLTATGIAPDNAWNSKLLHMVKLVDVHVQRERTLMPEPTPGAMIHGMMRASLLLDDYCKKGICQHSDIANSLVMAALEREGSQVQVAMDKMAKRQKEVDKMAVELAGLAAEWKKFKLKNGGLFK